VSISGTTVTPAANAMCNMMAQAQWVTNFH